MRSAARTIIVGDVHGCRRELEALLEQVGFGEHDRLVLVGDLVARGPDSAGVIDLARQARAVVVRGNHEEKLLAWRRDPAHVTLGREHAAVVETLRPRHWELLDATPLWVDLPEHEARVVHAGVVPGEPIARTRPATLLRIRTIDAAGHPSDHDGPVLWGERYVGPPHVVFGHHALEGLQLHRWATGLDSGCVYGGALTALVLRSGEHVPADVAERRARLVSQPASRVWHAPARPLKHADEPHDAAPPRAKGGR